MNDGSPAPTVFESKSAEDQINTLCSQYARAEELIEGIKWRLARDRSVGIELGNGYRAVQSAPHEYPEIPVIDLVARLEPDGQNYEVVAVRPVPGR